MDLALELVQCTVYPFDICRVLLFFVLLLPHLHLSSSSSSSSLLQYSLSDLCGLFAVGWRVLLLSIWWKAVVHGRLPALPTLAVLVVPNQWMQLFVCAGRHGLLTFWLWSGSDDSLEWALSVLPTVCLQLPTVQYCCLLCG